MNQGIIKKVRAIVTVKTWTSDIIITAIMIFLIAVNRPADTIIDKWRYQNKNVTLHTAMIPKKMTHCIINMIKLTNFPCEVQPKINTIENVCLKNIKHIFSFFRGFGVLGFHPLV